MKLQTLKQLLKPISNSTQVSSPRNYGSGLCRANLLHPRFMCDTLVVEARCSECFMQMALSELTKRRQTGNEKYDMCLGRLFPLLQNGLISLGDKRLLKGRILRPPDNMNLADSTEPLLTGRRLIQPQCVSNTLTVSVQTPITAV